MDRYLEAKNRKNSISTVSCSTKSRSYSSCSIFSQCSTTVSLPASVVVTDSDHIEKRRNPSFCTQNGFLFMFGGYNGKKYLNDLSLLCVSSPLSQLAPEYFPTGQKSPYRRYQIVDISHSQQQPINYSSSSISFMVNTKKIIVPKYDVCLSFSDQSHSFLNEVRSRITWAVPDHISLPSFISFIDYLTSYTNNICSPNISNILLHYKINNKDLFDPSNPDSVISNMRNLESVSSLRIRLVASSFSSPSSTQSEMPSETLFCDIDFLSKHCGFFHQFIDFLPHGCTSGLPTISLPSSFTSILSSLYCSSPPLYHDEETLTNSIHLSDYLICPLHKTVT